MAIIAYFESELTHEQYDLILSELEAKGLAAPDGRFHHVAWSGPQGWRVLDVWESEEKLGKFAEELIPIVSGIGVELPPPQVFPAHNIIKGK